MRTKKIMSNRESFWYRLPQYENMLNSIAWKHAGNDPTKFEELKQEAYLGYIKPCNHYDPQQKFSTYIYKSVQNHLCDYHKKENKNPTIDFDPERTEETPWDLLPDTTPNSEERSAFMQKLESLSIEAQEVVSIILEAPTEIWTCLINGAETACNIRSNLLKYLNKKRGWGINKIWNIFNEIRGVLNDE